MRTSHQIALVLLIAGGLNWLMVGLFKLDIVAALFGGTGGVISRAVYTIVGLCALYCVMLLKPGRPPASALDTDPYDEESAHSRL
jgi:uncharacterized protein